MANKKKAQSPPVVEETVDDRTGEENKRPEMNWRAWSIRAVLLTVLIFIFVLWRLYPIQGNVAFLWAFGLSGLILGWYVVSYYILNR